MNNNTASKFTDKQVMDLSNSQSAAMNIHGSSSNQDFFDFTNPVLEKKDDIVPSYDFMPIRPGDGSSSLPPSVNLSAKFDSGEDDGLRRTWNSLDSKINASPIGSYNSLEVEKPAKVMNEYLVSEIDLTIKKYTDSLMHAMDGVSARISQLETRTRKLENSIDDLKMSIGDNHGSSDGKMRQMENVLREVQTDVQVIRDKQEIIEAQMWTAKLQYTTGGQLKSQDNAQTELSQPGASTHLQFSTVSLTHPPPTLPSPNAPVPPPSHQNLQPEVQSLNHFSQNHISSVPHQESHFPPPGQTPPNPKQQYQIPPPQQHQPLLPTLQHQHQPPTPSQQHPTFSAFNPSLLLAASGHNHEEKPYPPPESYQIGIHPSPSHPSTGIPPPGPPSPHHVYGPTHNLYEPQSSRPSPYSNPYGPSGHQEPYPYNSSTSIYGSDSPRKPQSSTALGQSGGSGYPQLPVARILPQAIPTASSVGGGSGSGGSGNKVPIDDVVDKVTHMGFHRDQVRATVRKLTENGQSVDLNIVLDKLMNDGGGQPPRWTG